MTKTNRKRIKLLKGKFYTTFHTGGKGHPSLLFKKSKSKNKYWIVVFDTTARDDRKLLKYPIEISVKQSYVQKRPAIASHGDFGEHELLGLRIHKEDKTTIKLVKKRKPLLTKKYKAYKTQKQNKNKKPLDKA